MSQFFTRSRKIVAIGRNYADHAKELGNAIPKEPFFFLKPPSSLVASPGTVEIPKDVEVHHEVELAVIIGTGGRDIPASKALDHVAGYAVAFDLTARNVQDEAKRDRLPWTKAKGFDTFAPIGKFIPKEQVNDPSSLRLWCTVDGQVRQQGPTSDMIHPVSALISFASSIVTLQPDDIILTGTPSGVGAVTPGQILKGGLEAPDGQGGWKTLDEIEFECVRRPGDGRYGW
ncbi:fumarylacetoacetate hydrolase domain-containing protein 1 [Gonapodya prolifera JEL478]|uniref:Fumarylacetoacetate hydrolase domain-containing protein 1 n=1 Tax=Gonapodya prolifera (strain JEL478) TaxID=1344416 RepID=A0A139AUQ9_GONPJ|nr:fumarylacetoacetate hydrolase domain-containing protein 1 [Gonapodya prolifera JEL478]|eukprot:KXS20462.1 fumarylacetoacetate hydrolase domain-containing protein 1 [Gonapodya prolifera JEL478]